MLTAIIISLLVAIGYRARGGMFEQWGFRLPLCKFWFCAIFTICALYLTGLLYWQHIVCLLIGSKLSTSFCGWGEAVGCALGLRKPNPKEMNELDFDEFCDNFEFRGWKLIDHPQAYGVVWLTMRGVLLSYLIASPMNNVWYILAGAPMGIIYWFAGWLYRRGLNDGKGGWRTAEWLFGFYLGLLLVVLARYSAISKICGITLQGIQ